MFPLTCISLCVSFLFFFLCIKVFCKSSSAFFVTSVSGFYLQADVNKQDNLGRQALHHAAQAGQTIAVQFLLTSCDVPVDVTMSDTSATSLMVAAKVS